MLGPNSKGGRDTILPEQLGYEAEASGFMEDMSATLSPMTVR